MQGETAETRCSSQWSRLNGNVAEGLPVVGTVAGIGAALIGNWKWVKQRGAAVGRAIGPPLAAAWRWLNRPRVP